MINNIAIDNIEFLERLYYQYLNDKNSIDQSWHQYFEKIDFDKVNLPLSSQIITKNNNHIGYEILKYYRQYGHCMAKIDPLGRLDTSFNYKVPLTNLLEIVDLSHISPFNNLTIQELDNILSRTYSSFIGFEVEHIENIDEKSWLYNKIESSAHKYNDLIPNNKKEYFLSLMQKTKLFEQYLHTKFVGAKRFSIEGGETAILAIDELITLSANAGIDDIVIGMAHRGRLSTLIQIMQKPPSSLFAGFMGYVSNSNLPSFVGDVKYHLGYNNAIEIAGRKINLSLAYNPSHLESVNSVVMGIARAKHDANQSVIPLLIHGDASFAGQGCVMESLAMSKLELYDTGGVVHIIINNQIGFTTDPIKDRSTRYCSDIAKGYDIPILHVNGSDPEAVVYVIQLAFDYRQQFKKDVVIDLVCYRKYGHNEGDEPMFTQPSIYSQIYSKGFKDSVELYHSKLSDVGIGKDFHDNGKKYIDFLNSEFELAKQIFDRQIPYELHNETDDFRKHVTSEQSYYTFHNCNKDIGMTLLGNSDIATMQSAITGVDRSILKNVGLKLSSVPYDFHLNGKITRQFEAKRKMMESGAEVDWGTGEALALATLLMDGYNIRFTGEDVERGTFSHRHAVLTDQDTETKYIPLNNLDTKAKISISNSLLSEFGALGYEYGYAIENSKTLTVWEAQFGDFVNGAQIIIDQYIAAAESKWGILNNLVLLLPHGYEGQGPEHSSARLERFLQLCAENNIQVCNCTTPASIFHLLRRQMIQDVQKPLIVMTPKSLLRHKLAVSTLDSMDIGSYFQPLIHDDSVHKPTKTIFCSGKIYYDLFEYRQTIAANDIALVRIEQLYPFPISQVQEIISKNIQSEIVWCQEEPQNMGAFSFIKPIFQTLSDKELQYAGRKTSASPAVGFANLHKNELENLLRTAFNK